MGHPLSSLSRLFFPFGALLLSLSHSLSSCGDAPVTETSRSQSGKNFIHTGCQSRGEQPTGEESGERAASDWSAREGGGSFFLFMSAAFSSLWLDLDFRF